MAALLVLRVLKEHLGLPVLPDLKVSKVLQVLSGQLVLLASKVLQAFKEPKAQLVSSVHKALPVQSGCRVRLARKEFKVPPV